MPGPQYPVSMLARRQPGAATRIIAPGCSYPGSFAIEGFSIYAKKAARAQGLPIRKEREKVMAKKTFSSEV